MPRGCYAWQMGGVEDGPKPHTEVVKRERVREAAPKLDGQAPSKRVDAWKRDHSDFPALKSDSNKSGWVAGLCFLFGPPAGQPGLRTLSACRLPGGHKGRDSHPSASWLPLLAAQEDLCFVEIFPQLLICAAHEKCFIYPSFLWLRLRWRAPQKRICTTLSLTMSV